MKEYYGNIYVTVKTRLRISLSSNKKLTKSNILAALNHNESSVEINDINDEEPLEYLSVDKIDVEECNESKD